MVAINEYEPFQAASILETRMRALGIKQIKYSNDLAELELVASHLDKKALGEHFRRQLHTLPPNKFRWVCALDENSNIAGLAAARLDDIEGWTLQKYIHEHFTRCFKTSDGDPVIMKKNSSAFAKDITGKCAYLGEGFAVDDWRKKGLATLMVKHLMLITWIKWNPVILYGWMRKRHAITGMAFNWGFTETYQEAVEFENEPDDHELKDACFVGCREAGIHQMIIGLFRSEQLPCPSIKSPK